MRTRDFPRCFTNSGTAVTEKRQGVYDKQGRLRVKVVGETDLYSYIQSHADSVDIHTILKRFNNGDVSALNRAQVFYGDFTEMPKTYAEMLNKVREGEDYFMSLPLEVREKFGNDAAVFLAGLSDGSTVKAMQEYHDAVKAASAPVPPPVKEVKEDG